jgi:transcriptional regulator with XRE-family HTH domain
MNMEIGSRISLIVSKKGVQQYVMLDKLQLSRQSYNNYEKGKSLPNYETIYRILINFKDINARWLITGEGEMYSEVDNNVNKVMEPLPTYLVKGPCQLCNSVIQENRELSAKLIRLLEEQNKKKKAAS